MIKNPPDNPVAKISELGTLYLDRSLIGEVSIRLRYFAVGTYGFDETNPTEVLPVNPADIDLTNKVYPAVGLSLIESFERPFPESFVANCRINGPDLSSYIGEIGLYAEVLKSNIPSEIGTTFMFAKAHRPILSKTFLDATLLRLVVLF